MLHKLWLKCDNFRVVVGKQCTRNKKEIIHHWYDRNLFNEQTRNFSLLWKTSILPKRSNAKNFHRFITELIHFPNEFNRYTKITDINKIIGTRTIEQVDGQMTYDRIQISKTLQPTICTVSDKSDTLKSCNKNCMPFAGVAINGFAIAASLRTEHETIQFYWNGGV